MAQVRNVSNGVVRVWSPFRSGADIAARRLTGRRADRCRVRLGVASRLAAFGETGFWPDARLRRFGNAGSGSAELLHNGDVAETEILGLRLLEASE